MSNDLEPYENVTRVFWIKIEMQGKRQNGKQILGGMIRDVVSNRERQITGFIDIIDFINSYLEKMGIRISWFWRLTIWIKSKINPSK